MMNEENQQVCNDASEHRMSFLDALQESSVFDLISSVYDADENCISGLQEIKPQMPSIMPYAKVHDLNNSKEEPYVNKPKPGIEIGITFDF